MENKKASSTTQYLFFIVDDERYAVRASCVQEIVDFTNITKVPKSNRCVRGVTNIRGDLIAVIDSKTRFDRGVTDIQKRTSFIIINAKDVLKDMSVPIAFMVDVVVEVEDIRKEDILDVPEFGTKLEKRFIESIINLNEVYTTVLNIDEVLDIQELALVQG